jgi:hypothetical protein
MSLGISLKAEELRLSAAVLGTYTKIGAPLLHACRILYMQNLTDGTVIVSLDGGVTPHFALPAGGFILLDITSDKTEAQNFFLAKNTQVAAKGAAGAVTGTVYLSIFYGLGD